MIVLPNSYDVGQEGELRIFTHISKTLIEKKTWFYAFYNLNTPYMEKIGPRQIDMFFITCYGLLVIEAKNYRGEIIGDINDSFFWHNNNRVQNPYYQNSFHIKALSELLEIDEGFFKNIAIFNDSFNSIHIIGGENKVFSLANFIYYLNQELDISISKVLGDSLAAKLRSKGFHYLCSEKGPSEYYKSLIKKTIK